MPKLDMISRDVGRSCGQHDQPTRSAEQWANDLGPINSGRIHMHRTAKVFVAACVLVVAACTTKPLMNIDNAAIATTHTAEQVRQAIIAGGASKGWLMTETKPGVVHGTLKVRTHQADVDVTYNTKTYSIDYVSSVDLDYKNGTIHRNYNKWIANLNEAIQAQLNK
jgi:hypothetical protein